MSDFEIDRECLSDHQTLLHSPSAHATTAAAATDIPNANGSPWPTRGTNPSTGVDFSQRDAQALRGESTFCQPHAMYGGMGSGTQQFMHPYPLPVPGMYYAGHPGMFAQPMSGMAGVSSTLLPQQSHASTSGKRVKGQKSVSARSGQKSSQPLPRAYSSPQDSRGRSLSRSRRRERRSPSVSSRRRRGHSSSSLESSSPSRRSFVKKTRSRNSSSSSSHSFESGEEDFVSNESSSSKLSIQDCLTLANAIKPDLVCSSKHSQKKVLSAGERSMAKHRSKQESLCFVQSELVSDTLLNLQCKIRGEKEYPAEDRPADLHHKALKLGELLPASSSSGLCSFLAEGTLPLGKLTPSSSDLTSRSNPGQKHFRPLLKENGLTKLEESALLGLQCLSVTDSLLGVVADCLDESQPLDPEEYLRRPSREELGQLLNFACKSVNRAVGATARCYLNTVLIKRDSFLNSADKLTQDYDKSALRSLPISGRALIGPQVALNVEKSEKQQFDRSVRSIVSKADKTSRSPRKRARSSSDLRPTSGSKRTYSSAFRPSQQKANRGRFPSRSQKSKPKASAHPQ